MISVRDMTWTPSTVFMVTEKGELLSYQQGFFVFTEEVTGLVSVAYDWLAGKLYMSLSTNPGTVSLTEPVYDNKLLICKPDN